MNMNEFTNPWLALKAYQEKDSIRFKGREQDTANIVTLLQQNDYVVCYAASGDGKSSLINAGVCPKIRQLGMFPVKIELKESEDFDQLILNQFNARFTEYKQNHVTNNNFDEDGLEIGFKKTTQFQSEGIDNCLWWKLRTETVHISLKEFGEFDCIPVLIFDQFEEVLRAPWKESFFAWLEELSRDVCPDRIVERLVDKPNDLPSRKLFKILLSLRFDYVGELDYWCLHGCYIPQLMRNRYFLKPLTRNQAIAIIQSQGDDDDPVTAKLRLESGNIVDEIISSSASSTKDETVPAFLLSLTCYLRYDEGAEDGTDTTSNLHTLIYDYYLRQLYRLGMPDEDHLILESALISPEGTRIKTTSSDYRLQQIGIDAYLNASGYNLFSTGLFKIEETNNSHENHKEYTIEFIHDKLAEAIFKNKANSPITIKAKRTILYAAISLLLFGVFIACYLLNHPFNVSKDNKIDEDDIVIRLTKNDIDSLSTFNYWDATSIRLKRRGAYKNKIDCYQNVLVWYNETDSCYDWRYARNAKRLTFADYYVPYYFGLYFGPNTERVYLISDNNRLIDSVRLVLCENKNTIVYVPYGSMKRCQSNEAFNKVCVKELSMVATVARRILFSIHDFHLSFGEGKRSFNLSFWWVVLLTILLSLSTSNSDFKDLKRERRWRAFASFTISTFLLFFILFEFALFLAFNVDGTPNWLFYIIIIGLGFWVYCGPKLMLRFEQMKSRNRRATEKKKKQAVPLCWIIFNSQKHKPYAIALKRSLISAGLSNADIKLDLNIAQSSGIDFDNVSKTLYYNNIIFIVDKDDLTISKRNKRYYSFLNQMKHLHPVFVETDSISKSDIPDEIQSIITTRTNGTVCSFRALLYDPSENESDTIRQLIDDLHQQNPTARKKAIWDTVFIAVCYLILLPQINGYITNGLLSYASTFVLGFGFMWVAIEVWRYYYAEIDFPWMKEKISRLKQHFSKKQ